MTGIQEQTANRLGAMALALIDRIDGTTARLLGIGGMAPAALVTVSQEPGRSVETLARMIGLSQPATTRIVQRLIEEGLIERRPGRDARSHALHVTKTGARSAEAVLRGRSGVLVEAMAPLGPDQVETLNVLLSAMLRGLDPAVSDPDQVCRLCDSGACGGTDCPLEESVAVAAI